MVVLTEKFRFIRDDVFLCPWVDTKTGKQKLVMQKIDLETNVVEFEDSIDCIHTVVTDISLEEHARFRSNDENHEELLKETLFIRSSNELKEIHLSPEEKFKALKSWTAGIAEAGKDALSIQSKSLEERTEDLIFLKELIEAGKIKRMFPKQKKE